MNYRGTNRAIAKAQRAIKSSQSQEQLDTAKKYARMAVDDCINTYRFHFEDMVRHKTFDLRRGNNE